MTTSHQMNMKLKLLTLLAVAGLNWNSPAADKPKITANATNQFTITGMHCDGCAGGLKSELKETPGVASAEVTFSNKLAVVTFDTNKVTTAKLTKVIKDAGFAAKEVKP
jgi:mercuric ion binding protein